VAKPQSSKMEESKMTNSLKTNIGNFSPSSFDHAQINWKQLREQNAIPFRFYIRFDKVKEIETKSGDTATIVEGKAELDTAGLSEERITELENISRIARDEPVSVSFFPVGSMFLSQMKRAFGDDWEKACEGKLAHIAYNGKLDNPMKKGTKFHQIFITEVPEVAQEELAE
jgi:hypothetical protein